MRKIALFAGSFDPITLGHMDLIERAVTLFDEVIVVIAEHPTKQGLFTPLERKDLIEQVVTHPNVSIEILKDELLVNFAKEKGATHLVRGLRNTVDFEYELALADANQQQAPSIETLYLASSRSYRFVSSSLVREVASLNGKLEGLVPTYVEKKIKEKYGFSS